MAVAAVAAGIREAVLICNGLSAEGYEAPAGVYAMTLNGGFLYHRADAALTVDCPGHIRAEWVRFRGEKVVGLHMPEFPSGERYECYELVRRYGSSTPAALAWLYQRKHVAKVTIVGLDSLWGAGNPDCKYNRDVVGMLVEMAQYFPDGLFVQRGEEVVRVGDEAFGSLVAEWKARPAAAKPLRQMALAPTPERAESERPVEPPDVHPERAGDKCSIPQVFAEFDVSPKCTRKCSFCHPGILPGRRRQKAGLTLEAHNRAIDDLAAAGFDDPERWLCYCGHGEPLLCPDLKAMMRHARARLPACKMVVYTNGDPLTEDWCRFFEAVDLDALYWDNYGRDGQADDEVSARVPAIVQASGMDPERVRVVDHVKRDDAYYSSRCATARALRAAPRNSKPFAHRECWLLKHKLFLTDDGHGGAIWVGCCEDYHHKSAVPYCPPGELGALWAAPRARLEAGDRAAALGICANCDRDESAPPALGNAPTLPKTRLWKLSPRVPAAPASGRRLVIIPSDERWRGHLKAIVDAIDRLSVVPGKTLILWNAGGKAPAELKGDSRIVWEFPPLGWKGISVGLGKAYRYAVAEGYDWVVKLDTDTALLRRGWDAVICAECPPDAQLGTYMDESMTGSMHPDAEDCRGLFNDQLRKHCRWARGMVRRHRRGWDHMQGGIYAFGRQALERIEQIVGLGAEDQERLNEEQRVGEDVYFDSKAKLSGVRQLESLQLRSWYRLHSKSILPVHVRYHRDVRGCVAVHPVKSLPELARYLAEAETC